MATDLGEFKTRHGKKALGRDSLASEVARRVALSGLDGVSAVKVRAVLDELFVVLAVAMQAGKRVEIRGFGSFRAVRKAQRRTFVPSKGKVVRVDAQWKVRFEVGKTLKRELMACLEE